MTQPNVLKVVVLKDVIALLELQLASGRDGSPLPELHRLAANELLAEFRERCGLTSDGGVPEAIDQLNTSAERAEKYNEMTREYLDRKED